MGMLLIATLFTAIPDTCASSHPGTCSNVSKGEPLECCPNYRIVGNSCLECWPGSRGDNCAQDCADGFYGRLCGEKCLCHPCDKVKGCQNITILRWHNLSLEEDYGSKRFYPWFTMLSLSFCGFVVCCILCLSVFCVIRWISTARPIVLSERGNHNDKAISGHYNATNDE